MNQYIIQPLHLSNTYYQNTSTMVPSNLAVGYLSDGSHLSNENYNLYWDYPSGMAISSVEDLITIQQTLIQAMNPTSTSPNPLNISSIFANELFFPIIRVGDGSYLQGLPYEIHPIGLNYTNPNYNTSINNNNGCAPFLVYNKGGNLPGYTSIIASIPVYNVTIVSLFNGNVDEFGWSDMVTNTLLPTLASIINNLEIYPNGNPGPRPINYYTGLYTDTAGYGSVEIANIENSLLFKYVEPNGGIISFFMNYFTNTNNNNENNNRFINMVPDITDTNNNITLDIFQASLPPFNSLPPNSLSCTTAVTLGLLNQYIFIYINNINSTYSEPVAISMPGFIPGAIFMYTN